MSALGQKQTFAAHKSMSALPPKADMCGALAHVRFVPIADMTKLSNYGGATRLPYAFEVTPTESLHQMTYGGFPR